MLPLLRGPPSICSIKVLGNEDRLIKRFRQQVHHRRVTTERPGAGFRVLRTSFLGRSFTPGVSNINGRNSTSPLNFLASPACRVLRIHRSRLQEQGREPKTIHRKRGRAAGLWAFALERTLQANCDSDSCPAGTPDPHPHPHQDDGVPAHDRQLRGLSPPSHERHRANRQGYFPQDPPTPLSRSTP